MRDLYDLIIVGGGLGGAALALAMRKAGASVLVVERERAFRDRIRGEGMTSWGVAEARELGIEPILLGARGMELPAWTTLFGGALRRRELVPTTPQRAPTLSFYHPAMQEALLQAAASAGAEVLRGVAARGVVPGVVPGDPPRVLIEDGGEATEVAAGLVVGADGRSSSVRKWAGFDVTTDRPRLRIAGVLLEGIDVPSDTVLMASSVGRISILFPQAEDRVRAYFVSHRDVFEGTLSGEEALPRFIEQSRSAGAPAGWFEGARAAGPLGSFEGADTWVKTPYKPKSGVVLIGDAAASSDPSWGQGLSLTLRDVRVLRDKLLASPSFDEGARAYAEEHDRYYGTLRTYEDWLTELMMVPGPEADARRARAFAAAAKNPTGGPDVFHSGPDVTLDEAARQRFFGD
jgi:2-polyprenyl-6-methoxyphenol hydroxylase-like FAD-dependent oxidoreductase